MSAKPKNDEFWVVSFDDKKQVVKVIRSGVKVHIYGCGDEEGWDASRKDIKLKWIRRIRL